MLDKDSLLSTLNISNYDTIMNKNQYIHKVSTKRSSLIGFDTRNKIGFKQKFSFNCLASLYRRHYYNYALHSFKILTSCNIKSKFPLTYSSIKTQRYSTLYSKKFLMANYVRRIVKKPYKKFIKKKIRRLKKKMIRRYSSSLGRFYKIVFKKPKKIASYFRSYFLRLASKVLKNNFPLLIKSFGNNKEKAINFVSFLFTSFYHHGSELSPLIENKTFKFSFRFKPYKWEFLKMRYKRFLFKKFIGSRARYRAKYLLASSTSRAVLFYQSYHERQLWDKLIKEYTEPFKFGSLFFKNNPIFQNFLDYVNKVDNFSLSFPKILNSVRRVEESSLISSANVSCNLVKAHTSWGTFRTSGKRRKLKFKVRRYGGRYRLSELFLHGFTRTNRYVQDSSSISKRPFLRAHRWFIIK